jgi:membrane protein implicated in regulation of membrane protease activity
VVDGHVDVFLQGSWWAARPADPGFELVHDAEVEVTELDGLTLVVHPVEPTTVPPNLDRPTKEVP